MLDENIKSCIICEADFRPENLSKSGKCAVCEENYPDCKSKVEAMAKNMPEIKLNERITKDTVKSIIADELKEFKDEIKMMVVRMGKEAKNEGKNNKGGK